MDSGAVSEIVRWGWAMGEAKDESKMGSAVKTDMSDTGGDAVGGDQGYRFDFGCFKVVDQVHR